MVVSLATYVYATITNDKETDTNVMVGLAIADILVAAALFADVTL